MLLKKTVNKKSTPCYIAFAKSIYYMHKIFSSSVSCLSATHAHHSKIVMIICWLVSTVARTWSGTWCHTYYISITSSPIFLLNSILYISCHVRISTKWHWCACSLYNSLHYNSNCNYHRNHFNNFVFTDTEQ